MTVPATAMPEATSAITIAGLRKSYGEIPAVQGVDLHIEQGEMFGIVGPDGAGKTTLVRILCGILTPDAGSASVLGFDVVRDMERIKPAIGYLSQKFSLYPDLTVDENIEFFAEIHEVKDYQRRRNDLLEFTRLTPFRDRLADKLSGGMKQKLALACTLVHTPRIIFLDEPTTGVDPVSRRDFWKILSSLLRSGITIVMTTPYLDEAERCSRVAFMEHGKLLVVDVPQRLKERMSGTVIEVMAADIHRAYDLLQQAPGVQDVQAFGDRLHVIVQQSASPKALRADSTAALRDVLEAGGAGVRGLRVIQPSLENVFISLLQREGETSGPSTSDRPEDAPSTPPPAV